MPDKLPPFSPEAPPWLAAVKALIPADMPHVFVFAQRVEVDGERCASIGVACNCQLPFARELLEAGQMYIATKLGD